MATDLERAFTVLKAKKDLYDLLWQYYDGTQPLVYSTERLKETFRNLNARFNQNWCAVVVDSVSDRLNFKGFEVQNKQANIILDAVFNSQQISTDIYDAHEAALVCGEAYVITWKDADDKIEAFYNDPRLVHMFYNSDNPKVKEFAAKWWIADDKRWMMNLYYADTIEHYETRVLKSPPTKHNAFKPSAKKPKEPNQFGKIPVFHLRLSRRRVKSELANVISLQDAVNKLLADMMIAAEFGAFKQRWIISNSDTKDLKNYPGNIWTIPAGDSEGQATSLGQFDETNLDMYLGAIDKLVSSIAIITRTPKHYFMSTGASTSGDALIALESPLVRKVKRYADLFDNTWVEMAQFILGLANINIPMNEIIPVWGRVESVQPIAEGQARESAIRATIPLVTQLRREGWTTKEIEQLLQDKLEAQAKAQASLAQALLKAEREFNSGEAEAARRAALETLPESEIE